MKQLNEHHSFTGMQRDMSIAKHPSSFLYDAHNIRLTARGEDTLLTITNERGPSYAGVEIKGTYLGHCLLGKYLTVFSTGGLEEGDNTLRDYITRIDLSTKESVVLYKGNLNFDTSYLIETIGSYENDYIQKVYWTDGKNPPRLINIVDNNIRHTDCDTQFDFIRELALQEEVTIQKQLGSSGSFAPGVIQYAFTYYNKHGQETNIFYTSPLLYVSHKDRGASPEDKVENAFKITVRNIDKSFDYVRIYSIQRTSINAVPIVKRVQDINIKELDNKAEFLDTGTSGEVIDPTELLYKGGETVIAQTLDQKDGTLFLGNIETERKLIDSPTKASIKSEASRVTSSDVNSEVRVFYPTVVSKGDYLYHNQLTSYADSAKTISVPCGGFKRGDYYRCGVQFQYKDGRWSDPIFLNDEQVLAKPSLDTTNDTILVPIIKYKIGNTNDILNTLYKAGYRKLRPVVVFPSLQDRVTICQGVINPTLCFNRDVNGDSHTYSIVKAQSSWFFRPFIANHIVGDKTSYINDNSTVSPYAEDGDLEYANICEKDGNTFTSTTDPRHFRLIEIQGHFEDNDKLRILNRISSMHSPDIEFDDSLYNLNFEDTIIRKVGSITFKKTFSDISIQTETPQVSNSSFGFTHESFIQNGSFGIVAGLFYEDFALDDISDNGGRVQQWHLQQSPFRWMVYPWQRSGSLNNDITRPQDKGTATSVLKKKVISNLRYAQSELTDSSDWTDYNTSGNPQVYSSDQPTIIKVNETTYQGNIDTSLYPNKPDGMYFAFYSKDPTDYIDGTPFNTDFGTAISQILGINYYPFYKTFSKSAENANDQGIWRFAGNVAGTSKYEWKSSNNDIGNVYIQLAVNKQAVRMRYKSTPHLVLDLGENNINYVGLPIVEVVRKGDSNSSLYRSTMFGGQSEDALKANQWIPCGESVAIPSNMSTEEYLPFEYSYGDTYFQRWDCLKTYPFSNDDINQVVEIGSFMLETRVNIDGRYDRNRGQISNLNMSPINFNLFNPVYNQIDNFFTYRILDESYYSINKFPNQITWTKEKKAGADVDLWTNITLASTYDMDGSKGEVRSLQTWKDQIFCFQDLGISNILFNSRVQIPTSDGVPIEISNSYKVDGYRYISDGIGCTNKWTISNTPSGLYFADTKTNHLHHIGSQGIQDVTTIHNMTSWFNNVGSNRITKTLHDDVNHDLYALTSNESICYSEVLGNFTSFMSYQGISLIESYENSVYTMKDGKLYSMFTGEYNKFFGENYEPWDFTFISNGIDNNLMDFDKVYSTIDYRMDMMSDTGYQHDNSLDFIRVYNEYQDTEDVNLNRSNTSLSFWNKEANLQKKFRIWRIQIPRDKKSGNGLDRIRNTWCKIKLGSKGKNNYKAVLHDLNVQYYL